jgi:tetratricopeptide (TPR) repeat protein/transcriptional regulator with XRE-family HTH domain
VVEGPVRAFGPLLRQLRADAGLTQEELAEAASLSPRSISDLERGINATARKETARLLADALGLIGPLRAQFEAVARGRVPTESADRNAATGREPPFPPDERTMPVEPRFPGALPEVWNLPPRNPTFTGRAAELDRLHAGLAEHSAVTVHALRGMGGVGKTQTVIEYAHRHADDYDVVWWINAENASAVADQFAPLGAEFGLPALADPQATVRAVQRTLRTRGRWLLIFDNAESAPDIRALLPGGPGHSLITTRRGGFRAVGDVLDLDTLDRAEAVALLRRRVLGLTSSEAERITARLGDLPLALDQAAAFLDQTGAPAEEYLRLLDTSAAELYGRGRPTDHPETVATVWSVSFDRLRVSTPAAVQLLELCAWLAPEPIPLDLFTGHPDLLPQPLATTAADPVAFNEAVGALVDYSLIRRVGGMIVVHRLVQDVTRHRAIDEASTTGGSLPVVLALLRADLPGDVWGAPNSWPRWRLLLPSVLAATRHDDDSSCGDDLGWLLSEAGTYLRSQGRTAEALPLHQRALRIREAALDPDHLDVATDLMAVGWTLSALGRAAEALPLEQRALRIREAALGPDHPEVSEVLAYLGRALSTLGRAAEALPLYERALRIDEATFGPDHPEVATWLNLIGWALSALGRAAEALPLHQRALRIDEAGLGPDHPDVAADLTFIGWALSALDRAAEALPLQQRALFIDEAALGPDHPDVATDLNEVGRALSALGRDAEALPLQQRARRIWQAALGPDAAVVAGSDTDAPPWKSRRRLSTGAATPEDRSADNTTGQDTLAAPRPQ